MRLPRRGWFCPFRGRAGAASTAAARRPRRRRLCLRRRNPGPAPQSEARRGAEAEVRQQARRADDAELSGLAGVERRRGRRRPYAGAPQARRQRRNPVRCARRRLQSLPAACGRVRRRAAGTWAVRADYRRGGGQAGCRSGCRDRAVGLERRRQRADQGRLLRYRRRPRKRAQRQPRVRQRRGRAAETQRPARSAGAAPSWQRGDRAAGDRRHRGRENPHRRRRRPAERAVRAAEQPVPDGARRPFRADVRHAARPWRQRPPRSARRRRRGRPPVRRRSRPKASRSPRAPSRSALPANPLLPAEIALEAARRCDFVISGGGSAPFAVNGGDFRRLVGEAGLCAAARRADRVRACQQDGVRPGVAAMGPCRAPPAFDGRRLGALLARHRPHPARPDRAHRLCRRQPWQMAARVGDPRTSRRRRRDRGFRSDRPDLEFRGPLQASTL